MTYLYQVGQQYGIGILTHGPMNSEATILGVQNPNKNNKPYPAKPGDKVIESRVKPIEEYIVDSYAKRFKDLNGQRAWVAHAFKVTPVIKQIQEIDLKKRHQHRVRGVVDIVA